MKVNSSSHLIYSIIQELLLREQKKLDYLKDRILPHYKDPESIQVVKIFILKTNSYCGWCLLSLSMAQ